MRKIAPISFTFNFVKGKNEVGVNRAFDRVFGLAFKKMILDSKSTKEYSDINDRDWAVCNTRRSIKEVEGGVNNHIQDVQIREDTSSEVWRVVEDRQSKTDQIIKDK